MNLEERLPLTELLNVFFTEKMKTVYTAIPAHVLAFDPKTQLAQIELGIQRVDVNKKTFTPPPIIDCPVLFAGDKFCVETQIDPKCEGLAIFSQRCIDGWVTTGGVAENPLRRFHDIQDAFFIAGFRPIPSAIQGFSNDGIRLRNRKGNQYVWLKNDGSILIENGKGQIKMLSDGTVIINGVTFDLNGNVVSPSSVQAKTDVSVSGISLKNHRHGGVQSGTGTTGTPV